MKKLFKVEIHTAPDRNAATLELQTVIVVVVWFMGIFVGTWRKWIV